MKTFSTGKSVLLLAVALFLSCGHPFFYAEVDEKSLCTTVPNQVFPGSTDTTLLTQFQLPIGDLLSYFKAASNAEVDIELINVNLRAETGPSDFNWITSASASLDTELDGGSADGGLLLVQYLQDLNHLPGPTVEILPLQKINLYSFIQPVNFDGGTSEGVRFDVQINGDLPTTPWSADIGGCFSLKAKVYYLEKWGF